MTNKNVALNRKKHIGKDRWGIIFLAPFVLAFLVFQLWPLIQTVYYSFFEYYWVKTKFGFCDAKFIGLDNYIEIFKDRETLRLFSNTLLMWIMGFIPQLIVSLLLASWFANNRLRLKGAGFFKTVIYMPNLIMAIAFGMMFFTIFSSAGPVNQILAFFGKNEPIDFFNKIWSARILVAFINFLMWFGNTTILLMAGIMGINDSLFEAAEVDGASQFQVFRKITLPILKPIVVYVMITSLIGGIQMFDVPEVITKGNGNPFTKDFFATAGPGLQTVIMKLSAYIGGSKNYGMAGSLSVILLIITSILSIIVFKTMVKKEED